MLYAVGIVELEFESTSALVLLLFVVPLAFTLSAFLMWILWSLNGKHNLSLSTRVIDECEQLPSPSSRPESNTINYGCSKSYNTYYSSSFS